MTYQLMLFPNFKNKAFTMSYDDGVRHDIRLIEIMQKYGLKGTFNLNSGLMQSDNKRINSDEIYEVYIKTGNEVAIHGVNHITLTAVSEDRVINEIVNDRRTLESVTGKIIKGMAYSHGRYDDAVVDVLKKCGILYARTTVCSKNFEVCDDWLKLQPTCHHNDGMLFELAESFINEKKNSYFWANRAKIFYVWGHSYEFERDKNWDRIEKLAEKISNQDDVWYATNGEIVRYIKAYKALEYSVDGKIIYNPTDIDVYIRTTDNVEVTVCAGQCVRAAE